MATIQPHIHPHQQHDQYHLPPPHGAVYQQRPPEMYAAPPPPPAPQVVYQHAAAPRQRTAIACRYCRRRKIRCSGFDSAQDGRCSNCVRFNQECMFTPVSSQAAHAFVPAHTLLRTQGGSRAPGRLEGLVLYGAHGQPLPSTHPLVQPPPPLPPQLPETTLPPPQGMYQQHPYGRPSSIDDRGAPLSHRPVPQDQVSRKRPHPDDPRTPLSLRHSPPTSSPASSHDSLQRSSHARGSSGGPYDHSEPPTLPPVSAAVGGQYPTHTAPGPGPYYPPGGQDRRPSSYSYDNHPPAPHPAQVPQPIHPPPQTRLTPPPGQPGRSGLSVREMLAPMDTQSSRSSTDSDMLNALSRKV
ncbi:hypothetical protein AJ80_01863 [Polytolypa hystricis UAMH7299]|uniref:Zn(2)-C6 fungal-type domain-containing protein n=1 Tax=Polytolypa hystricis (strain UAMH7299) TaxID=1447883 RepID=A0A2B7YXI8_POLH7|nr:hypothetical protein AJ80_01863 [Polytolypa hystricis UAMH7299]